MHGSGFAAGALQAGKWPGMALSEALSMGPRGPVSLPPQCPAWDGGVARGSQAALRDCRSRSSEFWLVPEPSEGRLLSEHQPDTVAAGVPACTGAQTGHGTHTQGQLTWGDSAHLPAQASGL